MFDTGLEGLSITSFSDGRTDELGIFVSKRSLDRYIIRDDPQSIFYYFNWSQER